jgi:hypothetical protein
VAGDADGGVRKRKGYQEKDTDVKDEQEVETTGLLTSEPSEPKTPSLDEEDHSWFDALLTLLVRIVLAGVWVAVALGWVLEKISDVLAAIIEQCLAWMQPLQ